MVTDHERVMRLSGDLELLAAKVDSIVTSVDRMRGSIASLALAQSDLADCLDAMAMSIGQWRVDLEARR